MNIKQRMTELAEEQGRQDLYPYTVGSIKAVVACPYYTAEQKVEEIKETLCALKQAWNDESLPWDRADVKKAPASTGAQRKIYQVDSNIDLAKIESLVDRVWVDEFLRNEVAQ